MKEKNVLSTILFVLGIITLIVGIVLILDRVLKKFPLKKDYLCCEDEVTVEDDACECGCNA